MKLKNYTLLLAFSMTLTLFYSCPASKDSNPVPEIPAATSLSTWQVGTVSYSSSSAAQTTFNNNNSLSLSDGTSNSGIAVYFNTFPVPAGEYRIAKYNTSGAISNHLGSNEISVDVTINSGSDDYLSTGNGNIKAVVTLNNGKITVTLPAFWARHANQNGEQNDSLQVNGTIIEK